MEDSDYMSLALKEAKKGKYQTWKNPLVGAVVVKDKQILATGYHHRYGEKHAERDAISKLTPEEVAGSTLYVTLEPCNHQGKQPPCSQLIIDSKIKRVVIGQVDPHNIVDGKGIANLKKHGIEVTTGVMEQEAESLNPHYTYFYKHNRPWITLKQAVTLDHKVSLPNKRIQITNQKVYDFVHQERADYQAILIGSKTAIIDNPTLGINVDAYQPPIRIILDRRGRLLDHLNLKVLQDEAAPTWIFTKNEELIEHRFNSNVRVFRLETGKTREVIQFLTDQEVQSVYVEGGPTVQTSFIQADLANEIISYQAPKFLGTKALNGFIPKNEIQLQDTSVTTLGDNIRMAGKICLVD